ncbi:MAG: 2-oxoacid:acceptor oxidoreductase family protein [Candidatus Hodarchaeales archaeon]|jgi:2-oxoglutarate ferredoxin oxidoreductase subunit gamma
MAQDLLGTNNKPMDTQTKMERTEIVFAGMGGQGLITVGSILARAVILFEGKNSSQSQNYGPESRGGLSISEVIISDGEIDYPKVSENPHIIVTLSQESFMHFKDILKGTQYLIFEPGIVTDIDKYLSVHKHLNIYKIPFTKEAETLGNKLVANIIVLGVITHILKLNAESVKQAIQLHFTGKKAEIIELNWKALERGIVLGQELLFHY